MLGVSFTASASCPETIKSHISYGSGSSDRELPHIYKTLVSCPELRSLDLKLEQGGCLVGADPWSFRFTRGDRFPPLEELRLQGYDFDDVLYRHLHGREESRTRWYWARLYLADVMGFDSLRPTLDQRPLEPPSASNLDLWRFAMDWTKLKRLELAETNPRFLQKMTGQLPGLKSLTLGPWWKGEEDRLINRTSSFIMGSPPLSTLSLHGYTKHTNWTDVLARHGSTLKGLEIREWESENPFDPRPILSLPQIQRINDICPLLEELSVDINRNGTWPYELLGTLATFENLQKLKMWFELGIDQHGDEGSYWMPRSKRNISDEDYRQPSINSSSALTLFQYLRSQKKRVELQQLTLYVGDWGRDYGGGYRMPGWGEGLEDRYECSVLGDGGQRKLEGEAWCNRRP